MCLSTRTDLRGLLSEASLEQGVGIGLLAVPILPLALLWLYSAAQSALREVFRPPCLPLPVAGRELQGDFRRDHHSRLDRRLGKSSLLLSDIGSFQLPADLENSLVLVKITNLRGIK